MKQLITLMLVCFSLLVQGQTNITTTLNLRANDACVSGPDLFIANQIADFSLDGAVNKYDLFGNLVDSETIPADPSSDDISIPLELCVDNNIFIVVNRYFNSASGFRSESLLKLNSNLTINTSAQELVAFESGISSVYSDNVYVYAIITFSSSDSRLVLNNPDGTSTNLLTYNGNGNKSWLYRGDVNDLGNFDVYLIGDNSLSVSPATDSPDNNNFLAQKIVGLDNGNIVVEYMQAAERYLAVVDPNNPGTPGTSSSDGVMNPVQLLGPYIAPAVADATLHDNPYGSGYVLGYSNNNSNISYEFLDANFNPVNEAWKFELSFRIESFYTDNNELYANMTFSSSPGTETTRVSKIGPRGVEMYKKGHVYNNWQDFYKSFPIGGLTSVHVANHVGLEFNFNGTTIEGTDSSTPSSNTMVIYRTDNSGLSGTINLTDTNADFDAVYQNHRLDPNDHTQLIACPNEHTSIITLNASATIPADDAVIPASWISDIQVPAGYKLVFGENALMGTDPYAPTGFDRFFTIKIIPTSASGLNSVNTLECESMKVYVTYTTFTPLSVDDFENAAFAVYPNPTNDVINIKTTKLIERIDVYNIAGQVVLHQSSRNISLVNLGQLPSGLYMLRMYGQDGSEGLKKIIKQ